MWEILNNGVEILKCLALIKDLSNTEEKNKVIDFCRYEKLDIDLFSEKYDFEEIISIIEIENISKIIISSPEILDNDLLGFCKKMLNLINRNIMVFCASYDFPDPFQNAIRVLPYFGKKPERISRIKESINKKASRGQVLGKIPFGYKKTSSSLFKIDDREAGVVRNIFNLYLKYGSISKTSKEISRITEKKWSYQSIKHLLCNDFYVGNYRRYNVLIPNSHDAIIANSIFNKISKILSVNKKREYKQNFWNRLLFCKHCESKLVTTNHKNYWISNGVKISKNYKYYTCKNKNTNNYLCNEFSIKYEKLNSILEKTFSNSNFYEKKYSEKYLYKIVSEFTTDKIAFSDFEDEFNKLLFHIENSNKIIRKIIVSKDSNEIILSSI